MAHHNSATKQMLSPKLDLTKSELVLDWAAFISDAAEQRASSRHVARMREESAEISRRIGKQPSTFNSFFIAGERLQRDLTVASASGGGYLVGTGNAGQYAAGNRAAGIVDRLPLRRMPGLVGNVALPGAASSFTTTWLSNEGSTLTEGDATFGQISLSPKTVGTTVDISRHAMLGLGASGSAFVQGECVGAATQEVDRAFINGSGAGGEPTGLLSVSGTVAQSGTSLAWSGVLAMLETAEKYDRTGSVAAVMGTDVAKLLRGRERAAGSGFILDNDLIASRPAIVSSIVPSGTLIFAPWDRVVIGSWGAVEVTITPFAGSANFQKGIISLRVMTSIDFGVERGGVIAKSTSIT